MSEPNIDSTLVRRLVAAQFPEWAGLPIGPVSQQGWDNRSFHLGDHMVVRLPSSQAYALQIEKEQQWLPKLAPLLPLPIPTPLALGAPGAGYPWRWGVYRWLPGERAERGRIADVRRFASSLAQFLIALEQIDSTDAPSAGVHNFHRGGSLGIYDAETRRAVALLDGRIDTRAALNIWEAALMTEWSRAPVWIHGDVSADNLLVQDGRLVGVIDFGMLAVGDPACDLSIAWTFFAGESRKLFRAALSFDDGTWSRARGWTLWKALIVAAGLASTNAAEAADPWPVLAEVLAPSVV